MISEEFIGAVQIGINIGIQSVIEALTGSGVLIEMDGGIGYNGITLASGVSSDLLQDTVDDLVFEKLQVELKDKMQDELNDVVNRELNI